MKTLASGFKIEFKGLAQLEAKLKAETPEMKTAVMEIVKKNGSQMASKMRNNMQSTYKHPTGRTKGSVTETYKDAGFTVSVGPHTNYAPYLEYGTRFMSPRPTIRPAFLAQSAIFTNDLRRVFR